MAQGMRLAFASGGFLAAGASILVKHDSFGHDEVGSPTLTELVQPTPSNTNPPPPPARPPAARFNANANNALVQARTRSLRFLESLLPPLFKGKGAEEENHTIPHYNHHQHQHQGGGGKAQDNTRTPSHHRTPGHRRGT